MIKSKKNFGNSLTEKILWGIFNCVEKADDLFYFPIPSLYKSGFVPNVEYLKIMRKISWRKSRKRFTQFINDLKRNGYLQNKIEKNTKAVILTPKGLEKIFKIDLERADKRKRRDGKWQMIIWDIPTNLQKTRYRFLTAIKLLGYQLMQKSVWICPYDTLKETENIIKFYQIEPYVKIFLISKVEI